MAEEKEETQQEEGAAEEAPKKKGKSKMLIIIVLALVILGGGGAFAYLKFFSHPKEAEAKKEEEVVKEEQPVLFDLDPFVVNLTDRGRFLKVTMKLELVDQKYQPLAEEKVPHIRDAVITLISSKTAESISTPEGKFQLKDELLMRANASIGKDVFKNIYFTEFVMQ
ncbi:MAG: DUF4366 domain-containing protein [Nitrospirae bacterium]|nr:MAG: DUF4366 domain-containing protein [Nitrospirota bacterium]